MPIIIYTPPDAESERFEFDFDDLGYSEIVALEKLTEHNWGDLEGLYWNNNFQVQGALLLVLLRRNEPALTMEQLDLRPKQLRFDLTPAEKGRFIANLLKKADLTDEDRATLEAEQVAVEVAEDPKA